MIVHLILSAIIVSLLVSVGMPLIGALVPVLIIDSASLYMSWSF